MRGVKQAAVRVQKVDFQLYELLFAKGTFGDPLKYHYLKDGGLEEFPTDLELDQRGLGTALRNFGLPEQQKVVHYRAVELMNMTECVKRRDAGPDQTGERSQTNLIGWIKFMRENGRPVVLKGIETRALEDDEEPGDLWEADRAFLQLDGIARAYHNCRPAVRW